MFRETASAHRKTLQDAIHLLTPEEKAKIADQEQVNYYITPEFYLLSVIVYYTCSLILY